MRRAAARTAATIAMATAATLLGAGAAPAQAPPITSSFNTCPPYGDTHVCSGAVPSFDGTKLDVDLTLPTAGGPGGRHPLIVMLHGFGNDKHEWESTNDVADDADKWHWNSHWFAEHGYYVLTYTARGFRTDKASEPWQPDTPAKSFPSDSNDTIRVKSREVEIRDTQWLAALVAAAYPDVDRDSIAVTGGSYGGGESWLQASQDQWTFPHEQDSSLPILGLQVAVPKYPWTDQAYALAPNGHPGGPGKDDLYESSTGQEDSDTGAGNPLGVVKASFLTGLFTLGNTDGQFEEGTSTTQPNAEGPISITGWFNRAMTVGEPYDDKDPTVQQIRAGLTEFRGSYYQDKGWDAEAASGHEVAVFSIQGWTDDLFEAIESFRQFKALKRRDPLWPVSVALADVGHSRAQNKSGTWHRLNDQAWQFLSANVDGAHRQQTTVSSELTTCAGDTSQTAAQRLTASTPEGLSKGTLSIAYASGGKTTSDGGLADENGPATDPVVSDVIAPSDDSCRKSPGPSPEYSVTSAPLTSTATYVGLGEVDVPYTFVGGPTGELDARVWDVAPDGTTLLMTRGVYRIDLNYDKAADTLRLPLFGNHWQLAPGHKVRLDLTQVDALFLRPSDLESSIAFGPPTLRLPTREAGSRTLTGS
jgi:dienelactone hydrolase